MSSEEQSDTRIDGLDASPDDSKLFATLDKRQPGPNAERQEPGTRAQALGLTGAGPVRSAQYALEAKTEGNNANGPLPSTRTSDNQEGQSRLSILFLSSLMLLVGHFLHVDAAAPASLTTTRPLALSHTALIAGNASTPNLGTTLNTSSLPQSSRPASNNQPYDAASRLSTSRNPPPIPTKPRGDIRDRSSSHGAPSSFQSTPSGSTFANPETSRNRGQAGTYGSVKSNKEDGFKVSWLGTRHGIISLLSAVPGRACGSKRKECSVGCSRRQDRMRRRFQ